MTFGGFSTTEHIRLLPEGAERFGAGSSAWRLGGAPAHFIPAQGGHRRVLVLGWCGATRSELRRSADAPLPTDISWRWAGAYAVVEETRDGVICHTDPASALPVYVAAWSNGWAWSTSARMLAGLTAASVDSQRLACLVLAPSVPALIGSRTCYAGVEQLAPGCRIELPANGGSLRCTTLWRPEPVPGPPHHRLRDALSAAVGLRVRAAAPDLSCDLSGELDSTSVAVLAAAALPAPYRLSAVTIHPEGNDDGADLRYAKLASAAHPDRIVHHLFPLAAEHLPYTGVTSVPATDEPAPSTLTLARLTAQLRWMHHHLGSRTHLTGDGGDSVLFQPPVHLADLIRRRRWPRAMREALGWARLRHCAIAPLLVGAAATARTSRRDALVDLARSPAAPVPSRGGRHHRVGWFHSLPTPSWARPAALRLLADATTEAVDTEDPLPGPDASVRTLVDEIREVARTAAADAQLAATCGIDLHNPFLDARVMDAVLRTPLDRRPHVHLYKPVLSRAMRHLLPPEIAARTTKGSFNSDHYAGLRANLAGLAALSGPTEQRGTRVPETPRFATSPSHVHAVDFGHVLVLIDYRGGLVQCLLPAAALQWRDTALTGRPAAMAPGLANHLLAAGLLAPTSSPQPWPAPITARPAPASWGSTEHPAGASRPPAVPCRSGLAAASALAFISAVKRAGDPRSAMLRITTTLRTAASTRRRAATLAEAHAAVLAVRYAGWHFPGRTACLEESAAVTLFLAARRLAVTWCHGVAPNPVRLHAWIRTVDGTPVAEPPSTLAHTPVLTIGDPHQHRP
ncbi:lasso peptide biosynthesis B2 protein [Streptomyces paludis]|uniref:lasso peptide biosynthesis B2 protein n=1 Tax=Streptomyces paludis TaxID=2282738 RepID=UPI001E551E6D|nr:lasso peptide biosynthesis B2 protein [Streptomyces paludis]